MIIGALNSNVGVPIMVQRKQIQLGTMRMRIRYLASLSGLRIQRCRELWSRSQWSSDPAWLWLWRRLAATASISPLAWEPPYAMRASLRRDKKAKKKKKKKKNSYVLPSVVVLPSVF